MGFLGMGNYARPGKGVGKDEQEKKRIFKFFELFSRKFTRLVQLSLLFSLFCLIPVAIGMGVTYIGYLVASGSSNDALFSLFVNIGIIIGFTLSGPAMAAVTKIARCFSEEKPVFLMSDFWDAYKGNFRQSCIIAFINAMLGFLILTALKYYIPFVYAGQSWYIIPLAMIIMVAIIAISANFYTYLVLVSVELKTWHVIKNSVVFSFLGLKTNICTFFFVGIIIGLAVWYFPLTLLVMIPLGFSTVALIIAFNSFQYVYRYSIRPYYVTNNLPNPYEPEEAAEAESVFEDTI